MNPMLVGSSHDDKMGFITIQHQPVSFHVLLDLLVLQVYLQVQLTGLTPTNCNSRIISEATDSSTRMAVDAVEGISLCKMIMDCLRKIIRE